ncbi:MAG: NAD(P)H-binding protein [Woeseiaceae bacterium]
MTTVKKRILLAGATGYIGRAVAAELLDRGHELIAIVRDPAAAISGGETRQPWHKRHLTPSSRASRREPAYPTMPGASTARPIATCWPRR